LSNIIFPWATDVYVKLLWLPAIVICVGVIVIIFNKILLKTVRPERLILLENVLGYIAVSLALSIVWYWYIFLAIIWISRFPLLKILKVDLNDAIIENHGSISNPINSVDESKNQEPMNSAIDEDFAYLKDSVKKYTQFLRIFTFFFPLLIIVFYIISGIGYKL